MVIVSSPRNVWLPAHYGPTRGACAPKHPEPTSNRVAASNVCPFIGRAQGVGMSFLKRLLGKNEPPKPRIRVCMECGMPVAEHKDWCSIRRGQIEMKLRSDQTSQAS